MTEKSIGQGSLEQRIAALKNFVATKDYPCPSLKSGDPFDDILAVAAGSKTAATINQDDIRGGGIKKEYGIVVNKIKREGGDEKSVGGRGGTIHVAGEKTAVREICQLVEKRNKQQISMRDFDEQIGLLLGYPPEAVEKYLEEHKHLYK